MRSDPQMDAKLELLGAIMRAAQTAAVEIRDSVKPRVMLRLRLTGGRAAYLFLPRDVAAKLLADDDVYPAARGAR